MYKFLLSKPGLLIIFGGVFALVFWLFLDAYNAPTKQPTTPETSTSKITTPNQPANTKASSETTSSPEAKAPTESLNLELESLKSPLGGRLSDEHVNTTQNEGPTRPPATPLADSPHDTRLLPDRSKPSENGVIYGYEGKEEESHKVSIGVKKDDVTVKTQIKAGEKENEVQGVEIEIKLPK
jgi:cytoskeletal protein RodZ